MGSVSSKFQKAIYQGDEKQALYLYNNTPEIRKSLDPNSTYGDKYEHNTLMHYASRHGMVQVLSIFLNDHHGNPNKKNFHDETSLHCVCSGDDVISIYSSASAGFGHTTVEQQRKECLRMILQWKGGLLANGERECADVFAIDEKKNTALHYAASAGYLSLVELLLTHGAPLFEENQEKETPCDCAEKSCRYEIASYLESKMVFCPDFMDDDFTEELSNVTYEEVFIGMRPQELQTEKDILVVETSDMLRVPLFTAEALLRNNEWSREALLESWMKDAKACCEMNGVQPPANLDSLKREHRLTSMSATDPHPLTSMSATDPLPINSLTCEICEDTIEDDQATIEIPCMHAFCRDCWIRYLTGKITEGDIHNIMCPAYNCPKLVPVEVVEDVVPRDIARKYLQFDIRAFVDTNPFIKWCPKPGCSCAVKLPQDPPSSNNRRRRTPSPPPMSRAVTCSQGHSFCWECCGEPHEPCSCSNLQKWKEKTSEVKPEELSGTAQESESVANLLWLVTNSKPCPKCTSPIQKNEGCNHMKCTKCKNDFCWVCLEPWNKHSSETGGYFRCNRFEAVQKVHGKMETDREDAEKKNQEMICLNRFLHYYTRYKNHENSLKLEEPLKKRVTMKMKALEGTKACTAASDTDFIKDAIIELLKARHILKYSYAYGYYLEDKDGSKQIFEFMQDELEQACETLSQMVARLFLCTPRPKVIMTTVIVQRKRGEFLSAVSKGFLPPDSSPRTQPVRRDSDDTDEEDDILLRQAIEASLKEFAPPERTSWLDDTDDEDESMLFRRRLGEDSSGISEGLLRAFELSQQLLMQQTEGITSSFQSDQAVPPEMKELVDEDIVSSHDAYEKKTKQTNEHLAEPDSKDATNEVFQLDFELAQTKFDKLASNNPLSSKSKKMSNVADTDMSMDIDFDKLFKESSKLESTLAKRDCKKREITGQHEKRRSNSDPSYSSLDSKRNKERSRGHVKSSESSRTSKGDHQTKSLKSTKKSKENASHSYRPRSMHAQVRTPHSTSASGDNRSEKMSKVNLDLCHELESEFERIREEMKKVQGQVTELVAEHQNGQKKELGARKKERKPSKIPKTGSKSEGESEDGCRKLYEEKLSFKCNDDVIATKPQARLWKKKSTSSETDVFNPSYSKVKDDNSPWKLRDDTESSASWPSSPKRSPKVCRKITSSLYPDTEQKHPKKNEDVWQKMSDEQIKEQRIAQANESRRYQSILDTAKELPSNTGEDVSDVDIQMTSRARVYSAGSRNHESEWPLHEDSTTGWQMYI
ncbi:ankyrin repeat and IBR domain-containing protein 1-like [Antedon mediterranea]|uniref:ankyrin repeat and IBR domain-containing protein 1-like n=1 Tax=Antedon mediterranea TaxID=105859 RepID=UPI003AF611F5